jgi:hypothetical protein
MMFHPAIPVLPSFDEAKACEFFIDGSVQTGEPSGRTTSSCLPRTTSAAAVATSEVLGAHLGAGTRHRPVGASPLTSLEDSNAIQEPSGDQVQAPS